MEGDAEVSNSDPVPPTFGTYWLRLCDLDGTIAGAGSARRMRRARLDWKGVTDGLRLEGG